MIRIKTMQAVETVDAKLEIIYAIAESHLKLTLPKRDFGLPVIIELVGVISKNLASFRDEQKTEVIISILNRLYKSELLKAHLAKLPEPLRLKLDAFMENAMPHFVDVVDDIFLPNSLLGRIRAALDGFFGHFGCTFASCMLKTSVAANDVKAAIADGVITAAEVKKMVEDVKATEAPSLTVREPPAAASQETKAEVVPTASLTEPPAVAPSPPADAETRPVEAVSEKDATQ